MPEKPANGKLVVLERPHRASDQEICEQAIREITELSRDRDLLHVIAIAVFPSDRDGLNHTRVFTANLSYLEKLGLLEEARDCIIMDAHR